MTVKVYNSWLNKARGEGMKRKTRGTLAHPAIVAIAIVCGSLGVAAVMAARNQDLTNAARQEHRLVIYSATDEVEAADLLRAFHAAHPYISVDYRSLSARDVYGRFKAETDRGALSADLLINSAMDLQIKLVNDGYAQRYSSPEHTELPDWAVWKNQAFAVSAEPIVIGYNAKLLSASAVPSTHDDLAALLHRDEAMLRGRIGSYDPQRSPTGYLYVSQDAQIDRDAWDLIGAVGRAKPQLFESSKEMISKVSSGELVLAYNIIGSYAFERAARDRNFRVVVPQDYVLMMSRVALIAKNATHPASAKLFLNFMLSKDGQAMLAKHHMMPVRLDTPTDDPALKQTNVRAIRVGPALMAGLDGMTFARFCKKWREAVADPNTR